MSLMHPTPTISIQNIKGGVAKTTTADATAEALAEKGFKVALVDLDGGDSTESLSDPEGIPFNAEALDLTVIDALMNDVDPTDILLPTYHPNLFLLPSNESITELEVNLILSNQRKQWRFLLKKVLSKLKGFDYLIIDGPPSMGVRAIMALAASDLVVIPVEAQAIPLKKVPAMRNAIENVQALINPDFTFKFLLTRVMKRTILGRDAMNELRRACPNNVFETFIPFRIQIAEAPIAGQTILTYKPRSEGARAYRAFSEEIIHEFQSKNQRKTTHRIV